MREVHHNSPEQVRGYLREALAVVEELAPPDDLRQTVLLKAIDLGTAKQLFIDQSDASPIAMPAMAIPRARH